jgi:hypothetical protein
MLFRPLLAAGLLAALHPLASLAQAPAPASRFYAGLGVSVLTDAPFVDNNSSTILGPALAAGVQLSPRWAVQAGAALAWRNEDYTTTTTRPSGPSPLVERYELRTATLTVPILARFTFAPSPKRFHVDALGGLTVLRAASTYTYTATLPASTGQPPQSTTRRDNRITGNLSLGPGVRYTLTPHLELTAHALVNAVIGYSLARFTDRAFLNAQVGVHYTFG